MKNDNLKIKSDLEDRSYNYSLKIIQLLKPLHLDTPNKVIVNQLLRSATSVGANIVEARASSSKKDFTNYYHYALKSANESIYWIKLLRDTNNLVNIKTDSLLNETEQLARILACSILTLKGKR